MRRELQPLGRRTGTCLGSRARSGANAAWPPDTAGTPARSDLSVDSTPADVDEWLRRFPGDVQDHRELLEKVRARGYSLALVADPALERRIADVVSVFGLPDRLPRQETAVKQVISELVAFDRYSDGRTARLGPVGADRDPPPGPNGLAAQIARRMSSTRSLASPKSMAVLSR